MADFSAGEFTAILAAAGAAGATVLKVADVVLSKGTRDAGVRAADHQIAASEVNMLRDIIAEVRGSEAKKAERIDNLERRLDLLEERERHMLTRAAVHEAWDQMAFALIRERNPDHPAPPPLALEPTHDERNTPHG